MRQVSWLVIVALVCAAPLFCQSVWVKYPNPVLDVGSPGSWDDQWAIAGRVIRFGDTLKMWYSGRKSSFGTIAVGYAWSTDGGLSWTKRVSPVVVPTQAWEAQVVWTPYVIFDKNVYKMWYNGGSGNGVGGIGYAWSTNGIDWTKFNRNPVVMPGPALWDADEVEEPCVLADTGGRFKMWYQGGPTGLATLAIGYATGTNETTWTKADGVNPVLSPQAGTWEPTWLRSPKVLFDGAKYQMWYSAGPPYNTNDRGIGYATSTDGIAWTRSNENPVLRSTAATWDAGGIWPGDVLFDGAMYHMWYQAGYLTTTQTGYAVSPNVTVLPKLSSLDRNRDTVRVLVRVADPHGVSCAVEIESPDEHPIDTLTLYDDGAHGDSLASDGLFANSWIPGDSNGYFLDLQLTLHNTAKFELNNVREFYPVTLVARPDGPQPLEFSLDQNYPNPFNPITTIRYELPTVSDVRLAVFDILGREVALLTNGRKSAGAYEMQFNGSGLSSGVYFYRLQAGRFVKSMKLLLIR